MVTTTPQFVTEKVTTRASGATRPDVRMSNEELRELNRNRKIQQIAVVTRDLYRTMKAWVETLGIGPWTVFTFTQESVRGFQVNEQPVTEPFEFIIAIAHVGDLDFEIIQPVHGANSYERFLRERGEGVHHIKEQIHPDHIQQILKSYREKGIGVLQHGNFDIDFHYNLDTESSVRFILELGNCPRLDISKIEHSVYPPEQES